MFDRNNQTTEPNRDGTMYLKKNTSINRLSLAATVSMVALLSLSPNIVAADEAEKLADLQRQVDLLKLEMERQQVEVKGAAGKHDPEPRGVQSGLDQVNLTLSGQVNRGVLITDDGDDTDVFFVDNDNSSTRIKLQGDARLNEDISAGAVVEVQFESNSTADVSQDNQRNVGPNSFTERKLELFFDSETYGRLSVGQGDTASNGTAEQDLSGVGVVGYSAIADLAGGIQFTDGDGNLTGVTIGDTFNNFDGLSRDDRVRYDTPSFHGARLSGSVIADDRWDLAGTYSRKLLGQHAFQAAIGYADVDDGFDQISGSASILLGGDLAGVNMTVAAGRRDFDEDGRNTGDFIYGKLGYLVDPFSIGSTGLAVDYYYGEDVDADGDESTSVGLFAVQNVDLIGTELYAGFRNYELDREGEDFDDVRAVLVGARIKF